MILCDIDGVLAVGPAGDTAVGERIYRTWPERPAELERIAETHIPFHVVTAKVKAEALQVLSAVGADAYADSLISADRLFWPSVWGAIRQRRWPGTLSKVGCEVLLPARRDAKACMIENHHPHLIDMLRAGIVDFGILVPPVAISNGGVMRWFDLELALRLARELCLDGVASGELERLHVTVFRWNGEGAESVAPRDVPARIEESGYLLRLPSLSASDPPTGGVNPGRAGPTAEALDTGRVLKAGRPNVVTMVRTGRRVVRRILTRFSAPPD